MVKSTPRITAILINRTAIFIIRTTASLIDNIKPMTRTVGTPSVVSIPIVDVVDDTVDGIEIVLHDPTLTATTHKRLTVAASHERFTAVTANRRLAAAVAVNQLVAKFRYLNEALFLAELSPLHEAVFIDPDIGVAELASKRTA